jgi:hypothetical protein
MQDIKKAGKVGITKIGHTVSGVFGITPDARVRGRDVNPTEITHGKA